MEHNNEILTTLESLLKSAATGENFSKNEFDKERFKTIKNQIESLYKNIYGIEKQIIYPIEEKGYITPKIGVNAFIKNETGEVLLEQRADDNSWGLPGGWAEVGLTAEENIRREVKEETGFDVRVMDVIKVFSRTPNSKYLHTSYHILFRCEIVGGSLSISFESKNVSWRNISEVENWHADHKQWIESCVSILK